MLTLCTKSRLLIALILLGGVAFLSLVKIGNPIDLVKEVTYQDKLVHITMYFVLTLSWLFALRAVRRDTIVVPLTILAAAAFGLLMECLQELSGWRSFEWFDAVANTFGACCAALIYLLLTLKLHCTDNE